MAGLRGLGTRLAPVRARLRHWFGFGTRRGVANATVAVSLLCALLSLLRGQDANWDLRNYHVYNAWALLEGRLGIDLAPAQMQSYFAPLLDVPYFLLVQHAPAPLAGILLGLLHGSFPPGVRPTLPDRWWWIMLALLGLPIARRCVTTVADPTPERVQLAVKHCLLSIIVLDAAVTFLASSWYDAVVVLGLLLPAVLLGRWVYST